MAKNDDFVVAKGGATIPSVGGQTINKPVYCVKVENPEFPTKTDYYLSSKLDKNNITLVIRGVQISKAQLDKLGKSNAPPKAGKELEVEVPWQRVKRIDNLTYKTKAQ